MKNFNNIINSGFAFCIVFLLSTHFFTASVFAQTGSWTHIGLNNLSVVTLVSDPTNFSKLYAGTSDGVYQSTDGGNTWSAESNKGTAAFVVVISPSDHNILYATHGNTGIQKSIDGGNTWADITNNLGTPVVILDLVVNPTDPNTVIVAPYGNCLGIRKSTDGGNTWNAVGGGCDIYRIAYDPTNQNVIYAGGTNFSGYLTKSTDGGNTWNAFGQGLGSPGAVHGIVIDSNNSNNVYVGSEDSGVYKTADGGANWNLLSNSPSVQILNALAISQVDSSLYAKASSGVSQSNDGGVTWNAINTGDTPTGIEKLIILPNDSVNLYATTHTGLYSYGLQSPNNPPILTALSNATINEGSTYIANGSFTDADSSSWTATVNYGDGSGVQPLTLSGTNFSLQHVYATAGAYIVTISITDTQGATGIGTATITVQRQLTEFSPAKIWIGVKNNDDNGIKFDIQAEVYKDSTLISTGEIDSVAGGSSGFAHAKLQTIPFNTFTPIEFPVHAQLHLKLAIRNACSGSGKNSGIARLWYNDGQANSQFGVTIGTTTNTYYLLDNYLLGTTEGITKKPIDVQAGAKCSAFKPFGTWSVNL